VTVDRPFAATGGAGAEERRDFLAVLIKPNGRGHARHSSKEATPGFLAIFALAPAGSAVYCWGPVARSRRARSARADAQQPELPLAAVPTSRFGIVLEAGQAAKLAIARRAKPGAPRDHVRLVLTLELRTALAERLSEKAIRAGKNLEAVVIDMLEGGSK
jgi:hypothetical protein